MAHIFSGFGSRTFIIKFLTLSKGETTKGKIKEGIQGPITHQFSGLNSLDQALRIHNSIAFEHFMIEIKV